MTESEAEKVARELDAAAREALIGFEPLSPVCDAGLVALNLACAAATAKTGDRLATAVFVITPLGQAVAAILKGAET